MRSDSVMGVCGPHLDCFLIPVTQRENRVNGKIQRADYYYPNNYVLEGLHYLSADIRIVRLIILKIRKGQNLFNANARSLA